MMTDKIGLFVGIGFLLLAIFVFVEEDTTRTIWPVIGGFFLGLGVVMLTLVTKNWLHWRREWKAYRSPE